MSDTLIDLLRHGEPVGGRRYRGCGVNDPLSSVGWAQMQRTLGAHAPWSRIISSPLARCHDFAAELAERHTLPLIIEPALAEASMGAWEGLTHAEVAAREPEAHAAYRRDPLRHRPSGAEPLEAFRARVTTAYQHLLSRYPGEHLLICCHSGVTRAIIATLLDVTPATWNRLRIDYASLSRIRHGAEHATLECVNAPILPEAIRPV